ncbi:MAG: GH3, partial [uncultured Solirubrobacteraceae bacterium]
EPLAPAPCRPRRRGCGRRRRARAGHGRCGPGYGQRRPRGWLGLPARALAKKRVGRAADVEGARAAAPRRRPAARAAGSRRRAPVPRRLLGDDAERAVLRAPAGARVGRGPRRPGERRRRRAAHRAHGRDRPRRAQRAPAASARGGCAARRARGHGEGHRAAAPVSDHERCVRAPAGGQSRALAEEARVRRGAGSRGGPQRGRGSVGASGLLRRPSEGRAPGRRRRRGLAAGADRPGGRALPGRGHRIAGSRARRRDRRPRASGAAHARSEALPRRRAHRARHPALRRAVRRLRPRDSREPDSGRRADTAPPGLPGGDRLLEPHRGDPGDRRRRRRGRGGGAQGGLRRALRSRRPARPGGGLPRRRPGRARRDHPDRAGAPGARPDQPPAPPGGV